MRPSSAKGILRHLKEAEGFNYLVDVSCAHWPEEGRIDVVYQVRNLDRPRAAAGSGRRSRWKIPSVETVATSGGRANWLEREVYDLMGVHFHRATPT